ncbi:uncharacterized protein LOC144103737 [Amblyomma americanum]
MRRIFFVILSLGVQLNTVASDATIDTTDDRKKIGEGITVLATVYYDSSYNEKFKLTDSEEGKSNSSQDPSKHHFDILFKKVKHRFNKQNVSITINVTNVTQINNLSDPYEGSKLSINGTQTFDNLRNYSMHLGASNNTVYFLFTLSNIYKENDRGDRVPLAVSDIATYGTFCTNYVSVAVVKDSSSWWSYLNAVEALANT